MVRKKALVEVDCPHCGKGTWVYGPYTGSKYLGMCRHCFKNVERKIT